MASSRKSLDGRKRTRTMEYIDSQVDINDVESSQSQSQNQNHIGKQIDMSMSMIDESDFQLMFPTISKPKKRESERPSLPRQMSDTSLNRFFSDSTAKSTTELKGREHILRLMKTNRPKPTVELKTHRVVQEFIAQRQEQTETTRTLADFADKYGSIEPLGKKVKSRNHSEQIYDMTQQLETLKPTLNRHEPIDPASPLLRVVKLETLCNQVLCYCQYVENREDLVLFLDPNNEQVKKLAINDEIRIAGETRYDMNLPNFGSVTMGITDLRKESMNEEKSSEEQMEMSHQYNFFCNCSKCTGEMSSNTVSNEPVDLLSIFSSRSTTHQQQTDDQLTEIVYDSFTLALMTKRKFDLRGTIIIHDSDPHRIFPKHIFIIRDGIGNCLQISFDRIEDFQIELQNRTYIFHQIEFVERISSPKESNRWPYEKYVAPKKLFCFRSTENQVTLL